MKQRVSKNYGKLPGGLLIPFTGNVITCLTDNEDFPDLPIPLVPVTVTAAVPGGKADAQAEVPLSLTTRLDNYVSAFEASEGGGKVLTSAKNDAEKVLTDGLDLIALYVESVCRYDRTMLLSSGFEAVNTNSASTPLQKPIIIKIENVASGQLLLRVKADANARSNQVEKSVTAGVWEPAGIYAQSRRIVVNGLTPGSTLALRVRSVGGATYYSEWSDAVSRIVT